MFWNKKPEVFVVPHRAEPVKRFVVRATGNIPWKYDVYDTLRDVSVPKTEHTYPDPCQIDADYLNSMESAGNPIFGWEKDE